MKVDDIIALARAGFTAAQIAAINGTFAASAPAQAPAPAPAPDAPAAPAPAPVPAPATPAAEEQNAEILRQLGIISGQITAAGIAGSTMPPAQSVDQILASIIAPPIGKDVK